MAPGTPARLGDGRESAVRLLLSDVHTEGEILRKERVPWAACQPVSVRLGYKPCQPKWDIASGYGTTTSRGAVMN